jgi:ABC-type phosphate transport system substrate-binding protein
MKEIEMVEAPTYQRPAEMGMLIDSIAQYNNEANAIGYSVYYYAKNMYAQPGLKFLRVDGVEPNNVTIQKGEYPHVKDFYAVIREDENIDTPAHKVFEWLTSKAGQKLVSDSGYVSVK